MTISFKDLNIQAPTKGFSGDKIKINKVLNKEIKVNDFKIVPSKFEGKGDCLHLSFTMNENSYVVFTGSFGLMDMIKQVPKDKFPFLATIVEDNDSYLFT